MRCLSDMAYPSVRLRLVVGNADRVFGLGLESLALAAINAPGPLYDLLDCRRRLRVGRLVGSTNLEPTARHP